MANDITRSRFWNKLIPLGLISLMQFARSAYALPSVKKNAETILKIERRHTSPHRPRRKLLSSRIQSENSDWTEGLAWDSVQAALIDSFFVLRVNRCESLLAIVFLNSRVFISNHRKWFISKFSQLWLPSTLFQSMGWVEKYFLTL